jgi:hypothetical protein
MATLDDLHLAMGRCLTESSHAESVMFSLYYVCNPNRSLEQLFNKFMDQTFGTKIEMFQKACEAYAFCDEHRAILTDACNDLNALLPKRNFIVHGSTYQIGLSDRPPQPYRIGKRKGHYGFLNDAVLNDFADPHVFTVERINKVTEEFVALGGKLGKVATEMMALVSKSNQDDSRHQ